MNQPYESYKPSGIDWLGEIPSHWDVKPIKYVVSINSETLPEGMDQDYALKYIDIGNVDSYGSINTVQEYTFKDAPSRARRVVREGDVIVSTVRTYLKAIAYVGLQDENLIASTGFAVLRNDYGTVSTDFLKYAVRGEYFIDEIVASSAGVSYPAITASELGKVELVIPPLTEQRAIAEHLDRKTTQIDDLVARKEQLLALLQQKRQAIINEAVTRGLDANAQTKDSGIDWLGDIPAHWEVKKLKWVSARITDGAHISPDTSAPDYPFVSTVDIKQGRIDFENCLGTTAQSYDYLMKNGCKPSYGDILFSKDGTIGRTTVIDFEKEFVVASSLIIISPDANIVNSQFLELSLQSLPTTNQVEAVISGSALRRISILKLTNLSLAIPPLSEQKLIFREIDQRIKKIQKAEKEIKTQLAYFKTYRQSLISEVVTGKVDVRAKATAGV